MAQKMTFGLFGGSSQRVEYVRLRGPHDKGHAEIAVSKPKGSGVETPTSEPGFCMTDGMWDSESESDTEEFVFKHHVINLRDIIVWLNVIVQYFFLFYSED